VDTTCQSQNVKLAIVLNWSLWLGKSYWFACQAMWLWIQEWVPISTTWMCYDCLQQPRGIINYKGNKTATTQLTWEQWFRPLKCVSRASISNPYNGTREENNPTLCPRKGSTRFGLPSRCIQYKKCKLNPLW
jgi:hypothetical protein